MAVERVVPEDENKKEYIPDEIIIDGILEKFDNEGEFVVRGDGLVFYRKHRKYFDLMTSKYHLIYARTLNNLCLTELGDKVVGYGGWSKYLEFKQNEAKSEAEKMDNAERLERELKESTIKVNNLTIENSEQNKRIADLNEKNLELQTEKLEFETTIREQEQKIRNLEEQTLFLSLLQKYWWVIITSIGIGIGLKELWDIIKH